MRPRTVIGSIATLSVVGLIIGVVALTDHRTALAQSHSPTATPSTSVALTSLTPQERADLPFQLFAPPPLSDKTSHTVTRAAAIATAESMFGATASTESELLTVDDPNFQIVKDYPGGAPGLHRLAWIIALPAGLVIMDTGGPITGTPPQSTAPSRSNTFVVVVVDAATGIPILDYVGGN